MLGHFKVKTYKNLYPQVYDFYNLFLAFKKAKKGKSSKDYVISFEKDLGHNLNILSEELLSLTYRPKSLQTFILRDPKTRKISKSDFRDRIIHHAICNIIEPILDRPIIYDSYANRKGKGTLKAIERFDYFKRKVTKNNHRKAYCFKADIKQYFENVDHNILIQILSKKIKDKKLIKLIKIILENYKSKDNKGMPLGNLTSQFFANVYLNELDQFIKYDLKIKYYLRYVDDFVILDESKTRLKRYRKQIESFLRKIKLELHPQKTKIIILSTGINFLGFRIFYYHKLLKKSNLEHAKRRFFDFIENYDKKEMNYDKLYNSMEGWIAYVKYANTYKLRNKISTQFKVISNKEVSTKELNRMISK